MELTGKKILMCTTNGTRAIQNSLNASRLLTASFLNAGITVQKIRNDQNIVFVCAGDEDHFSLGDTLCAGYLLSCLAEGAAYLSDGARMALDLYHLHRNHLTEVMLDTYHARKLLKLPFGKPDIEYCCRIDLFSAACERSGQILRPSF